MMIDIWEQNWFLDRLVLNISYMVTDSSQWLTYNNIWNDKNQFSARNKKKGDFCSEPLKQHSIALFPIMWNHISTKNYCRNNLDQHRVYLIEPHSYASHIIYIRMYIKKIDMLIISTLKVPKNFSPSHNKVLIEPRKYFNTFKSFKTKQ